MKNILKTFKLSLIDINPWHNIKLIHTNIQGDILSGVTVAIIALPLALAFGEISQLGPIAGVWGAIAGGIVGGLFGGCMVGVSGPTAPKAAQIAAFMSFFIIGTTNEPDLVAAFSIIFLSGLILIAISMMGVSRFIHYIPYPVISGFMCGIGVIVILTQINSFLGLEAEKNIHGVFENLGYTIQNVNVEALYIAIPSLLILFLWGFVEKRVKILAAIPAPLIALVVGTLIAYLMNSNIPYIGDKMGSADEGKIFSFYIPDFTRFSEFLWPAFALAGLAILDSLLSCKVADNMTGMHHNSNRETFGQGMANIAAGLFGGVTTATATMRTVANIKFGGKTPLASIVHGLTLLAILLGLGFLVAAIPTACLAAILFKVGIDIMDYRILPILKKLPLADLLVFSIVLFVTVYQDLMLAVAIGAVFAFIGSFKELKQSLKPEWRHKLLSLLESNLISNTQDTKTLRNAPVNVLQPQGPLFFASVEPLISIYKKALEHEILIIDMSRITMIDISGVYALEDLISRIKSNGIKIFILGDNSKIEGILKEVGFIKNIGIENYKESRASIESAIAKHYQLAAFK